MSSHQVHIRRLKRITLSIYDFDKAIEYGQQLGLLLADPGFNPVLREALEMSMRVSYIRPFSGNNTGAAGDHDRNLSQEWITALDTTQQQLHNELKTSRHQIYAHSDPDSYNLEVEVHSSDLVSATTTDPFIPFSAAEIKSVVQLCNLLRSRLYNERHSIAELLGPGIY